MEQIPFLWIFSRLGHYIFLNNSRGIFLEQVKNVDQLIEENSRLRAAVEELSILNDIATAISSTQSLEKIVDLIVHKCVKHLRVEQGAVMLSELGNEFFKKNEKELMGLFN